MTINRIISVLILLFVYQTNNAQLVNVSLVGQQFFPSEIILNNGDTISGYTADFTAPKALELRTGFDFRSIEERLRLTSTKFKFKSEINGKVENLDIADIKAIKFIEYKDTIKFEKLKLKTVNRNAEVVDLERIVMIPLIQEGKINLYGIKVMDCSSGCVFFYVLAYIKKPNDEFAYIPFDMNRFNFNAVSMDNKFRKAFQEVGSDCPEFLAYIEKREEILEYNYNHKKLDNEYGRFEQMRKEKLKQLPKGPEKRKLSRQLDVEFFLLPYNILIDQYSTLCK